MGWEGYWKKYCAPKLKARKDELGRGVSEREIAAYVEANSGKKTTRSLVSLFLLGEREPYISQFFAMCKKLDMEPDEVLTDSLESVGKHTPLFKSGQQTKRMKTLKKLKDSR